MRVSFIRRCSSTCWWTCLVDSRVADGGLQHEGSTQTLKHRGGAKRLATARPSFSHPVRDPVSAACRHDGWVSHRCCLASCRQLLMRSPDACALTVLRNLSLGSSNGAAHISAAALFQDAKHRTRPARPGPRTRPVRTFLVDGRRSASAGERMRYLRWKLAPGEKPEVGLF